MRTFSRFLRKFVITIWFAFIEMFLQPCNTEIHFFFTILVLIWICTTVEYAPLKLELSLAENIYSNLLSSYSTYNWALQPAIWLKMLRPYIAFANIPILKSWNNIKLIIISNAFNNFFFAYRRPQLNNNVIIQHKQFDIMR